MLKRFKLKKPKDTPGVVLVLDKPNKISAQLAYKKLIQLIRKEYPNVKIKRAVGNSRIFDLINKADLILTSSYLSILESSYLKKPTIALYHHPLKKDYLDCHPISKYIVISDKAETALKLYQQKKYNLDKAHSWAKLQTTKKYVKNFFNHYNQK